MKLKHDEAEPIGLELAARWEAITGQPAPRLSELAWADAVQFVLRRAGEIVAARDS